MGQGFRIFMCPNHLGDYYNSVRVEAPVGGGLNNQGTALPYPYING